MKKRIVSVVLTVAIISIVTACGNSSQTETAVDPGQSENAEASEEKPAASDSGYPTMTIQVGTTTTAESPYVKGLEVLAEQLSQKTDGAITLEIFSDGQLGGEVDLIEGVSMGTVNMCVTSSSPVANYVTDFFTFDLPFLITDLDKAHDVMDGELGRSLLDQLGDTGIYGLALWDNRFRNLTNSNIPVHTLADVSGMKIRVMENEVHQALWTALGAYPTPMAWGEVITALEQGTIDAEENPLNAIYSSGVYEVQKYITKTNHVYTAGVCMINQDLWNSFSDEVKEVFRESMEYATDWEREHVAEAEEEVAELLTEAGCEINDVDNIEEWSDAVSGLYETYADKVNQELVEALRN